MNIKIVYNNKFKDLLNLKLDFPDIKIDFYDDEYFKHQRKSIMLKAGLGTKLTPFCVLYNEDNTPIKCFYSEVNECNYETIKKYIYEYNK